MNKAYGIGRMSRETGVNIETIRYYERISIMPEPGRTQGGNRQYSHDHLKRLTFIRKSRDLGFSLAEVRALLDMVDRTDFTCGEVHEITITHLETIKQKLAGLKRLDKALRSMAAQCSRGDVPDCPIVDILFELS